MKKLHLLLALALMPGMILLAQAPQAFKYQAIARDEAGNVLSVWDLSLRVSLIQEGTDGKVVYTETHIVQTNIYGLINLIIGEGDIVNGDLGSIKWGENRHYIKMEMDIDGGEDYKDVGISQLYAVPYALYAEQAGNLVEPKGEKSAFIQQNPHKISNNIVSTRDGTPNSKFPADTSSYMNVNVGNVGIGTTDPQEKLDVNGNVKANHMILTDANGNQWEIVIDTIGTILLINKFGECGDSLYDYRDGKYYQTVLIGTQCWMTQNLNLGTKVNSTASGQHQTNNDTIEKYCYNNDESQCDIYGGLYEWNEAMQYVITEGAQGICPPTGGWHIPTDGEWTTLTEYLGGSSGAGGKMKEAGYEHWNTPNEGANNESGFTGLPGGIRDYSSGSFFALGVHGYFWSSSEIGVVNAWYRGLAHNTADVNRDAYYGPNGFSVRCLQDGD